jgi:ammonium transporter Rh
MILITWQMIWWGLNENIGVQIYNATDAGGSMFVHSFGAYYGLGACYFFQPKRAATSNNLKSSYQSEMIAVIGAIFLWMFWPSFNGALASDITQHRIIVNTVLAISGSCLGAVFTARILLGKLEMEILLNATLAGGVIIGSSVDMCHQPWQAMLIGLAGGILSALGF